LKNNSKSNFIDVGPLGIDFFANSRDRRTEKSCEFKSQFYNCANASVRKENPCFQGVWILPSVHCLL